MARVEKEGRVERRVSPIGVGGPDGAEWLSSEEAWLEMRINKNTPPGTWWRMAQVYIPILMSDIRRLVTATNQLQQQLQAAALS